MQNTIATVTFMSFINAQESTMDNQANVLNSLVKAFNKDITLTEWNAEEELVGRDGWNSQLMTKTKTKDMLLALGKIERDTVQYVANQIVHAMEKSGLFKQVITEFDGNKMYTYYDVHGVMADNRSIALFALQSTRMLAQLDKFYALSFINDRGYEDGVCGNVNRERVLQLRSYNQIHFGNLEGGVRKGGHIKHDNKPYGDYIKQLMVILHHAGLVDFYNQDGIMYVRASDKYMKTCVTSRQMMHQTQPITDENRRRPMVKGMVNDKQIKNTVSKNVRGIINFIEEQSQELNEFLLDAVVAAMKDMVEELTYLNNGVETYPEFLKDMLFVINGASTMKSMVEKKFWSEYFMDLRGRIYQACHAGMNPQAADLAKALCFHSVENFVAKGSEAYDIFMTEMTDEVLNKNNREYFMREKTIRQVVANPAGAIKMFYKKTVEKAQAEADANGIELKDTQAMRNHGLPFKKFFSYIAMCKNWVEFEDNGQSDVRLGFGPDCKTSGAQILAIMSGARAAAEACGLIAHWEEKLDDLYTVAARIANEIVAASNLSYLGKVWTRDYIKTPFMAIQYGGGLDALMKVDSLRNYRAMGVPAEEFTEMAKIAKEAIVAAMGSEIETFLAILRAGVANRLNTENEGKADSEKKYSFKYRHFDGMTCTQKAKMKVQMVEQPFRLNVGMDDDGIIFGNIETGSAWEVKSQTEDSLHLSNFSYYFPVHFVQGLDAVMARTVAKNCRDQGIRGFSTIHDQFRCCLADAPEMNKIIADTYREMFTTSAIWDHYEAQFGFSLRINPNKPNEMLVTEDVLQALGKPNGAYFFG